MTRAKATLADRPMPALADGTLPRAEQRVITPDGPGMIVWSVPTGPPDGTEWHTAVRLDDVLRVRRYRTADLRPEAVL